MIKYLLRRLAVGFITLLGIVVLVFFSSRLTGSPIEAMYPDGLEPGQLELFNAKYGFDKSYADQFVIYLKNLLHGDFGESIRERRDVRAILTARSLETLRLGVWAFALSVTCGISLGVCIALNRESFAVSIANNVMALLFSIPNFIIAIFLMLLFSFKLKILPSQGGGSALHYIMPVACFSLGPTISIAWYVKNGILETISQNYIRTAVAKGLGKARTIIGYAFRNALIPVITQVGMVIVDIVTGSLVIETVFSWPGVGYTLVNAVLDRDFPVVQGIILFLAGIVIALNFLLEILCMMVDPRINREAAA
jgi:peptide/nickel transport system permease protein